jgi:hypothetical protein
MSAGNIQLAAVGQQDAHLTGEPTVTYFAGVYKRHTPFVLQAYEVPFMGTSVLFNSTTTCRIPYKGDLVKGLTLKMNLPYLVNEAGRQFVYPTPASENFAPFFYINGGPSPFSVDNTSTYYYSTLSVKLWLGNVDAGRYVTYANERFTFRGCSSVTCTPEIAVFWGLDPKNFDAITADGRLTYVVPSAGRVGDFNLEQCGWVRAPSVPLTREGAAMHIKVGRSGYTTPSGFVDLNSDNWLIQGYSPFVEISNGGCARFLEAGIYMLTAQFGGACNRVSIGKSTTDQRPASPSSYVTSHTWTVSANHPGMLQLEVTEADLDSWFFLDVPAGTHLDPGAFMSIAPDGQQFRLGASVPVAAGSARFPLKSCVSVGSGVTVAPDHSFTFTKTGTHMLTATFSCSSESISAVECGGFRYETDQTFDPRCVSIPITVTSTSTPYTINVFAKTPGTLTGSVSFANVTNGLLIKPTTDFAPGVVNLGTRAGEDVQSSGDEFIFEQPGLHMLTAVVDGARSIQIGAVTHAISVVTGQSQVIKIPFFVTHNAAPIRLTITAPGTLKATGTYFMVTSFNRPIALDTNAYNYVDSVGTHIIKTADLYIGGQLVQSLPGEMIELWNDLHVPLENQPALTLLTGKSDTSSVFGPNKRTYYVNLPFYFYGHPELSIPLAALSRQDVEVRVSFRGFDALTPAGLAGGTEQLETTMIVEYVYLGDSEIKWIQNNRLDYVITQTQWAEAVMPARFTSGVFNLHFSNPVKEMLFVIQKVGTAPYDFSGSGLIDMALTFNADEVFRADADFLGTLVPWRHYGVTPTREFYVYSFATDPMSAHPTGQVNFSRIRHKSLEVNCATDSAARSLHVYCTSYNVLRVEGGLAGLLFNV